MTREKCLYLRSLIEKAAQSLDDKTALTAPELYPRWQPGMTFTADDIGKKLAHNGKLYTVRQAHTSQESWLPGQGTESLYAAIDEDHQGTQADPIPYEGNMALEADKYYSQNGVIYKCTRDTGNPVYHALADLVGLYVEVVQ